MRWRCTLAGQCVRAAIYIMPRGRVRDLWLTGMDRLLSDIQFELTGVRVDVKVHRHYR
jgi:hypothetical protein